MFSSVAQLCLSLCDPMNRSMPGLSVHHQLPESTQTHVHWVGDAIQPSHPLSSPSPPALSLSQHQGLFQCCFIGGLLKISWQWCNPSNTDNSAKAVAMLWNSAVRKTVPACCTDPPESYETTSSSVCFIKENSVPQTVVKMYKSRWKQIPKPTLWWQSKAI